MTQLAAPKAEAKTAKDVGAILAQKETALKADLKKAEVRAEQMMLFIC